MLWRFGVCWGFAFMQLLETDHHDTITTVFTILAAPRSRHLPRSFENYIIFFYFYISCIQPTRLRSVFLSTSDEQMIYELELLDTR